MLFPPFERARPVRHQALIKDRRKIPLPNRVSYYGDFINKIKKIQ